MIEKCGSVEERMARVYIETMPEFHPSPVIDTNSQRALYNMICALIKNIAQNPTLLAPKIHDDGYFTVRFNKTSENKPELQKQMRDAKNAIDDLTALLIDMFKIGTFDGTRLVLPRERKVSKRQMDALATIGIGCAVGKAAYDFDLSSVKDAIPAWRWMAGKGSVSVIEFGKCAFDAEYCYQSNVYARMLGDEAAFHRLEDYLIDEGYRRTLWRDNAFMLDYTLELGDKESQVKDAWAERTHTGIELKCDPYMGDIAAISLRVPKLAELLKHMDDADAQTRGFLLDRVKKCDGCRYCVQTDKKGTRPLANIEVFHDGKPERFCPIFAGYSFCYTRLNSEIAENFIGAMEFSRRALAKSK